MDSRHRIAKKVNEVLREEVINHCGGCYHFQFLRDETGWIFMCRLLFREQGQAGEIDETSGILAVIDDPVDLENFNGRLNYWFPNPYPSSCPREKNQQ